MGVSNLPGAPNVLFGPTTAGVLCRSPRRGRYVGRRAEDFFAEHGRYLPDGRLYDGGERVPRQGYQARADILSCFSPFDRPAASRVQALSFHLATATTV